MSACIEQALEDSNLRASLSSKGTERASSFRWQRCAEETLTVLKSAADS
jgi:glycosyltransferase involved in cell wall biosynthesis